MEEGRVRRYGRNESDRRRGRCDKKGSAQIIPAFLDYYVFLEL